jgi:ferredoxin
LTEKVKVRIDGQVIAATPGQTILEVARANDKYIPALCYMEGLSAVGACRLCMVEVSGVARLLPACTTPVQEGLAVSTNSEQLHSYRKIALELLLVERNHVCAVCVSSGHCELQALAQEHGVTHVRYPYNYPKPAFRAGPQPLHPVLALRANVRRDRGRSCLGYLRPRHPIAPGFRVEAALGRGHELHQLRQVRPSLPDRRNGREGLGGRRDDQAAGRRG